MWYNHIGGVLDPFAGIKRTYVKALRQRPATFLFQPSRARFRFDVGSPTAKGWL